MAVTLPACRSRPPLPPAASLAPLPSRALQHTVNAIPGGLLSHIEGRVHYLDLAGVQAHSLSAFGEWAPRGA